MISTLMIQKIKKQYWQRNRRIGKLKKENTVAFILTMINYKQKRIIGVRAGGAGGAAAPPVSKIFGQNAKNSGNKETINDGIEK